MLKRSFYPKAEVEKILEATPAKKVSQRVNELILKGVSKEREEEITAEYREYDKLMGAEDKKRPKKKLSATKMMSKRLFESEDEPEDWY